MGDSVEKGILEETFEDLTAGRPIAVEVRSVEQQLADLWGQAAITEVHGATAPISRALLANMVVFAATDEEADRAAAILADLSPKHPSRAIVVDYSAEVRGGKTEAYVSMRCGVTARGDRRLCGEQIRVHAHGLEDVLMGDVMPFLIPDLPVYLWIPGDLPTADDTFRRLVGNADHLIVDWRRFRSWKAGLEIVGPLRETTRDLAWLSLGPMQEALAEHFDPPALRQYLPKITKVYIGYQPDGFERRPPAQTIFLLAWMMAQLGWSEPEIRGDTDPGTWQICMDGDGCPVTIEVSPIRMDGNPPGEINGVIIEAGEPGVTFRTERRGPEGDIALDVLGIENAPPRRTLRRPIASDSEAICLALDTPGRDPLYPRVLDKMEPFCAMWP